MTEHRRTGSSAESELRRTFGISSSAYSVGFYLAFFGVYGLACIVYYQQRFFFDAAYFLTTLVQNESFSISQGDRYASGLLQLLPILGVKSGAPLWGNAILYSLNIWAYHFAVAALLFWGFRRRDLAWAFVLFLVAYMTHCFVYPHTEPANGAVALFPLVALLELEKRGSRLKSALVFLAAIFFSFMAIFYHPLLMPVTFFFLVYVLAQKGSISRAATAGTLASIATLLITKFFYISSYESEKIGAIDVTQPLRFLAANTEYFAKAHFLVLVVVAYLLVEMVRRKRLWAPGIAVLGIAAYILLIFTTFSARNSWIYLWHAFMPVYAMAFIPLMHRVEGAATIERHRFAAVVALVAIVYCFLGIRHDFEFVERRHRAITNILAAHPDPEARLVSVDSIAFYDFETGLMQKKLVEESMLITSYDDPAMARVLMPERYLEGNQFFAFCCNTRYFPFEGPITKEDFVRLNSRQRTEKLIEHARDHVRLDWPPEPTRVSGGKWLLGVTIVNDGNRRLSSRNGKNVPLYLGYRWWKEGQVAEKWHAAPLRIDVHTTYTQYIPIEYPPDSEGAKLQIDLAFDGRWLNVRPVSPDATYLGRPFRESDAARGLDR